MTGLIRAVAEGPALGEVRRPVPLDAEGPRAGGVDRKCGREGVAEGLVHHLLERAARAAADRRVADHGRVLARRSGRGEGEAVDLHRARDRRTRAVGHVEGDDRRRVRRGGHVVDGDREGARARLLLRRAVRLEHACDAARSRVTDAAHHVVRLLAAGVRDPPRGDVRRRAEPRAIVAAAARDRGRVRRVRVAVRALVAGVAVPDVLREADHRVVVHAPAEADDPVGPAGDHARQIVAAVDLVDHQRHLEVLARVRIHELPRMAGDAGVHFDPRAAVQ